MLEYLSKRPRNSFINNLSEVFSNAQIPRRASDEKSDSTGTIRNRVVNDIDNVDSQFFCAQDEFHERRTSSDDINFRLPENQVSVNIKVSGRSGKYAKENFHAVSSCPLYLYSCMDEFSRDFCTVVVGDTLPVTMPIAEYSPELTDCIKFPDVTNDSFEAFHDESALLKSASDCKQSLRSSRILQHYHPAYPAWPSNFKSSPVELANIFLDKPATDSNILLKVLSCSGKGAFEPLFGSITLYLVRNEELFRLSETFHFDATPEEVKEKYMGVYESSERHNQVPMANSLKNCLMRIPEDFQREQDLFFVVQVHKVLSGDTEKALGPYLSRGSQRPSPKHEEQCARLSAFRQPLGLGIVKVYDESGVVGVQGKSGLTFRMYAQKSALTESKLLESIRSLYPKDKSVAYTVMDITDIEVKLGILDLGRDGEMTPEWASKLSDGGMHQLKELTVLPPPFALSDDIPRKMAVMRENVIYVYPLQLERVTNRNLSVCVQLVEFASTDIDSTYTVLPSVYNSFSNDLCEAAYTGVHYHTFNPTLLDEVKIQLPHVLSNRHALRFAVYHIHVKPKQSNPGIIMRFSGAASMPEQISQLVGECFQPLITNSDAILSDDERTLLLSIPEETPAHSRLQRENTSSRWDVNTAVPSITFRTRLVSALFSSCPCVQKFFNSCPVPLGVPPSSRLISHFASVISPLVSPSETIIGDATVDLLASIPSEVTRHFLVIMRQLARIMCGGRCVKEPLYANPYNHPASRCTAFLSMLQILGKISPDVYKHKEQASAYSSEDLLSAYLDYVFDEEVCVDASYLLRCQAVDRPGDLKGGDASARIVANESSLSYMAEKVEEIILEGIIHVALASVLENADIEQLPSRLFRSRSSDIFDSSPFKEMRSSINDNKVADLTTAMQLNANSKRISRTIYNMRRTLSPRYLVSIDGDGNVFQDNTLCPQLDCFDMRNTSSPSQWWPYLYEVLIQQWIAVLCVLQGKEPCRTDPCGKKYPFTAAALSNTSDSSKDSRVLLLDHSPFIFRLIFKSLALRIVREGKSTPVKLDELTLGSLETLVRMLSDEAASRLSSGLTRSKRLNQALAQFLRRLVALIAPAQVLKLISVYFMREKTKRSEEIGLRLQVIEELGVFDLFVPINFVASLDVHLVNHRRLAHLCIDEVMFAYRLPAETSQQISLLSIRILRDMLVRHSYDARFQDNASRQRIACMYIPLLGQLIVEADRLSQSAHDSAERRDLLSVLLYLLQDLPERQLREHCRILTSFASINAVARTTPSKKIFLGSPRDLPIMRLLTLLHLVLDTFDYPHARDMQKDKEAARSKVLVPGLAYSNSAKPSDHLSKLDELMYHKKGREVTAASKEVVTERKWAKQRNPKLVKEPSALGNTTVLNDLMFVSAAAKGMCHESTLVVLKTLRLILDEAPFQLIVETDGEQRKLAFDELMSLSVSLLLHGLVSNQSEIALIAIMEDTRQLIRRFGARVFSDAAGDAFQDWIRRILMLCAYPLLLVRHQSCDLFLLLFQSSFFHGSSLTLLKTTTLGVFQDVMEGILTTHAGQIDSVEREDEFLSWLRSSILHMRDTTPTSLISKVNSLYQSDLEALRAHIQAFMDSLDRVLAGNACLRRHLTHPVGHDFLGANLLDGPMNERAIMIAQKARTHAGGNRHLSMNLSHNPPSIGSSPAIMNRRVHASGESVDTESQLGTSFEHGKAMTVKLDIDAVMELFIEVSTIFDSILLPRLRMRWLEQLARLHDVKMIRAEAAEIRWRLFKLCEKVKDSWEHVWAPREPLVWTADSNVAEHLKSTKNFLHLYKITLGSPGKWWPNASSFREHMETCLRESSKRFAQVSLFHMAERGYHQLLALYRMEGRLADMSEAYQSIAGMFKSHLSSSFAMGLFYRVLYLGRGSPEHLRGNEYVYRNANSLHLNDFQKMLTAHVSELVPDGTKVTVVLDTAKIPDDNAADAFICLTSVKAVKKMSSKVGIAAANQFMSFQYSVPFTLEGGVHAKSIDKQWKRTTILEVEESFPYMTCRQLVTSRSMRELNPVENAIDDILMRIDAMNYELGRDKKDGADTNNLMRIVQGSVMPQVNGGALEVARVFLSVDVKEDIHFSLEKTLSEFLSRADKLLEKSRRLLILNESPSDDGSHGRESASILNAPTSAEISNYKWQQEMEIQFDLLVEGIRAYVKDAQMSNAMYRLMRRNKGLVAVSFNDGA